jgi:hypothetical protein
VEQRGSLFGEKEPVTGGHGLAGCAMKRGSVWSLAGGATVAGGMLASGCPAPDTCLYEATCSTDGGSGDAAAVAMDGSGDGGDGSTAADASTTDGGFDGDASDVAADSSIGDGAADAGDGAPVASDAGPGGPFLGTWTLVGTETFSCPNDAGLFSDASANVDPVSETVTFSAGLGSTDAGQVDLLFDAGEECALEVSVEAGVAMLVDPPQTCALDRKSTYWVFTSVTVSTSMGSVGIMETFTDDAGCRYLIQADLTRSDGG